MKLLTVPVTGIEINSPFFFQNIRENELSIEHYQKHHHNIPITVIELDQRYVPLNGKQNLTALHDFKLDKVSILLVEDMDIVNALEMVIGQNGGPDNLSTMDKFRILSNFKSYLEEENQTKTWKLIGEYPSTKTIDFYESIKQFPEFLLNYIERYSLSKKQIEALIQFPEELLQNMAYIGDQLAIRPVEFLEFSKTIYESHRFQKIAIEKIFDDLNKFLDEDNLNRNEKIKKIKDFLRKLRFPNLHTLNQKLDDAAAILPGQIRVQWLQTLEKPEFDLSLKIKTPEDISGVMNLLSQNTIKDQLINILKILHGNISEI